MYLENKKLNSVLENYFEERYHIFNDDKNVERINRKIKAALDTNKGNYKYFYIVMKNRMYSSDDGTSEDTVVRLFGSNRKLKPEDFNIRAHLKDKKAATQLESVSTAHTKLIKSDLDKNLQKYVLLAR